ncbi:MAG: isoaspartyl peptidase/L-asparaginase family protein [Acidimicrobiales bacterium]
MTAVTERMLLSAPVIVIHGGAGAFERVNSPTDEAELADELGRALQSGWAVLQRGGPALESVVEAVAALEDGGRFNAGAGGSPTIDGTLELDAAVMDGRTGAAGGVCAATWPRNPVRAARAVAALGGPAQGPVLLAGVGADRFAAEVGLAKMQRPADPSAGRAGEPASSAGTVGAVAVDASGHVAAATSTGGRAGQRLGRVGDSPIPGAGTWADDETAAISATGDGEAFVVAGFAHLVDWALRDGWSLSDSVSRAMTEVARRGGEGGVIAVTAAGEVLFSFGTRAMARGLKDSTHARVAVLGSINSGLRSPTER